MTSLNADLAVAARRLRYLAERNGVDGRTIEREWIRLMDEVAEPRVSSELAIADARARWEREWGR
jgi:hypothetical protein